MRKESEQSLQIPPEEIGRQAVSSLRGYIYQIYQSLAAWLSLSEDETLLLEVAEDYAVLAKGALTAVQIKDTANSGSVTVRSPAIGKAIQAFWNFRKANPERLVRFHYLTTSEIGKEKARKFPNGQPGLLYWRTAAREGTDIEPIRQALLTLELSGELKDFIEHASPKELREGLLRRIKWDCGRDDISAVDQAIRDRLVYIGERQHLAPSDSERARDALVAEILRVIVREKRRELNRADLLRVFEKSVSVSMPISTMRKALSQVISGPAGESVGGLVSHASSVTDAARVPLPPRVVDRAKLVHQLTSETGRCGALWLQGSSGVGKTLLAQFIARRSERDWFLVELRGCSGLELEYRLRTALAPINARNFGGIILDDFPMEHASSGRLRLSILASEVQRCDGALVVTSTRFPSPSLEGCFGEAGVHVRDVPYLTEENVMDLVGLAGGEPDKWAKVTHTSCGFGHPQLVHARISGLRHRGWPEDELLAGMPLIGGTAKEVDDERAAIRVRLFAELPENARELLYRLTLITSRFDRTLAIAVGEVGPSVPRPGEAFDLVVGPWVEVRGEDRFSVSPLIGDAGAKNLSTGIQLSVHRQIVDQLITRKPFPADFLGQLLNHALISRHESGIAWLSMAVSSAKKADKQMICEQLFLLALLDTYDNKPLFPENTYVSTVLRLAQLDVAVATNRTDRLEVITERLIAEARILHNEDVSKGFVLIAISKALMERSLQISPKKWIPLLAEFEELLSGESQIAEFARTLDPAKEGLEHWKITHFMFVNRATSLSGIDDLVELFEELDRLSAGHRNDLLSALRKPYVGGRLMVHSSWMTESVRGSIDGVEAAQKFLNLVATSEQWGNNDLAVECEIARVIMIDEYAHDAATALAALSEADKRYPSDMRLVRQRAKIHYRQNDYSAALEAYEAIADVIPEEDAVERAFAFREAGISAAETGNLPKARHFFDKAYQAANKVRDLMLPMAAGLMGDCAVIEFQMENYKEALRCAAQALRDGDEINPEAGRNEKYCALILGHMILWMRSQVQGSDWSGEDFPIFAGCCSSPEPLEEIRERKTPPKLLRWYQLAELEAELGFHADILEELRRRTGENEIFLSEFTLNFTLMSRVIKVVDINAFCAYLPEYVSKTAFMVKNRENLRNDDMFNPQTGSVKLLSAEDWSREPYLSAAQNVILAFETSAVCSGRSDVHGELVTYIENIEGANSALKPFFKSFQNGPSTSKDAREVAAQCVGRFFDANNQLSPGELFLVTCYLWNWLAKSDFRLLLGSVLAVFLTAQWRRVIEAQRFMLTTPMRTVPALKAALDSSLKGVAKLAAIALAAEHAVGRSLSGEMRKLLEESVSNSNSES